MLSIKGLRFTRANFRLELALELPRGAYGVILGPSGCGKSTALRLIAGLLRAEAGSIELAGRRIEALPPERRRVGMVFQDYALFPHLSVRRNIEYGPKLSGEAGPARRRHVEELAHAFRIDALLERRPTELSGGEQQRVALARSLAARPEVLLLDEPLSSLDASLRRELRADLRARVLEAGLSALHVTHDLEEALAIADRLYVMDGGRIVESGPPEKLYARPLSAFTAGFLGRGPLLPVSALLDEPDSDAGMTQARKIYRVETAFGPLSAEGPLPSGSGELFLHFSAQDVRVSPGETRPHMNRLRGRVVETTFLGRTQRLALAPPEGGETIELELDPLIHLTRGELVALDLPIDRCMLLR